MKRLALSTALLLLAMTAKADLDQLRGAAQSGNVEAQLELGELYEFGFAMPQNAVPAYLWYSIAAARGNTKAAQRRDLIKSKMSAAELSEAERQYAALAPTIPTLAPPRPEPTIPSQSPPPTTTPDVPPTPAPSLGPSSTTPPAAP